MTWKKMRNMAQRIGRTRREDDVPLRGEMELDFLKNAKKQGTIFAYLKFLHA
jgi:hypothetical protein